jgi:hypothetical protein
MAKSRMVCVPPADEGIVTPFPIELTQVHFRHVVPYPSRRAFRGQKEPEKQVAFPIVCP